MAKDPWSVVSQESVEAPDGWSVVSTEPAQPARRAVNLGEEPPPSGMSGEFAGFADVFAPPQPRQESVLQGRPMREPAIARDKLLDPSFVDAIRQNVEQMDPAQRQATLAQMARRTDVYGRAAKVLGEHYREVEAAKASPTSTVLARPRVEEQPTFLGQMARGARGALEYGLPSMGIQLGLQGSASAMVARQGQLALMDRIDQGEFKTLEDLKNDPQYQTLREEGDIGLVNSYFSNRGKTEINSRLRNRTQQEITKLVGDTAGHIRTLNQYARENKEKYGPSVEKFTDLDWSDPRVVSDFKNWLGYNMGAGAVQMAPIMLAAITTKRPGLLATSASMGVSEAVGARLKFIQDQVKNLPADQRGAAIAKYIADSGDTNLITGLVSGSFDLLLGPAAKAAKAGLPQEIGKLVAVKKAVKELPSDIGGEAVTGALQQATQIAAAKKLQEEGRAVTLENIKDIIDSAAAEATGAPFGTAINVAMAAATAPSAPQARIPQPQVPPAPEVPPSRAPRARVEPRLEPGALPAPTEERREPTDGFEVVGQEPSAPEDMFVPGMPTGEELEESAPVAQVDLTGWTESPNTINKKTGEPRFPEGTQRFTKEDELGNHTIILRDGKVSQSRTMSKPISLVNSAIDFDAPVTGRIDIDHGLGLLYFVPDDGAPIKMSPRAVQMYQAGESLDKIAELEFSDAGGIRPDGTRTPHTTIGTFVGAQPTSAPAAPPTALPPAPPPTQAAAALPETPTVPPVTKPKAFEPAAEQQALGGLPIQEVPLSQLRLSKDVPQFKVGASEKGVVEPLGGKFERTGVAPIQVWRRLDGSLEIISGRHRFDLAQRSGEKTIPAQIHDEAQGFNADKAAVLDAELNIRDGQGKVKDYVNYFQGSKISREEANARGLLARALGKRAYSIAADGSEELVAAVRADQIGDEAAYYVALNAPKDSRLQGVGIKAIMDGKSMNTAVNMMQAVKALAAENDTTTDLFGYDDSALREAEEMAKIAAKNQRSIQARLSAITGASKNPELARQEGIDIRDPEAVQKRIGELRQMKAAWDNWNTSPELIAQIREERGQPAPTLKPIEPAITAQTEEDLRQKAEREAEADRRQREEKAEAERKAKADAERDEFVLTGSDRAADEAAARGQADIFAEPAKPEAKKKVGRVTYNPNPKNLSYLKFKLNGVEFSLESAGSAQQVIVKDPNAEDLYSVFYATGTNWDRRRNAFEMPDLAAKYPELGEDVLNAIDKYLSSKSLEEKTSNGQKVADAVNKEIEKSAQAKEAEAAEEAPPTAEPKAANPIKVLEQSGFVRVPNGDPKQYVDKGGQPYLTMERGPVRIALQPSELLFVDKNAVIKGMDEDAFTLAALLVEPDARGQGLARKALQDVIKATDSFDKDLYLEPAPLDDQPMSREQLIKFYKSVGFEFQPNSNNKVMVRKAGAAAPQAAEPGDLPDENDPGFLGASDKEVKDVAKTFDQCAGVQEDEQNTRVFDAPKKSDIVRIEEKSRSEGVLTIAEAKKRIAEWKKNAQAQGETGANSDKVVLSLFDATGEWSKPWEEAGYQVFRFDIQTDPEMGDVNKFSASFFNDLYGAFDGQDIYAVLAACPCTDFAASGARHFAAKDESGQTVESVQLVKQTLATIEYFKPSVWAIENPVGRIEKLTGLPPWRMSFNPNHFGDPYTKKTLLWGRFNADLPVAPVVPTEGSKMHRMYGGKSQETKNARSVTPEGFAYAFFQANNAVDNPVMAVANKYDMMDPAVLRKALDAGMTEKDISSAVDDSYYDGNYKAANSDLNAAIEAKKPKGAAVMGQRMVNAADRFRKAAMSQFKLTEEQADAAMGKLLKEKILILDSVTGQFELKDGRFWDREVLLKAAGEKQVKIEEPKEIVTARKELKKVKPGEIITPAELARRKKLIEYEKKQKGKEYEAAGAVVVNDKTPSADLPASKRLVIMPCCDMKGDEKAPAMELYKGVFFQTFRGNVQEGGRPNVVILSAKHGFIAPTKEIEPYDQMMTSSRSDEMLVDLPRLISNLQIPEGIEDVLIVGGKDYQRVMKAAVAELQKDGTISENASVNATSGGIGDQRKQLGEYLRSIPSAEAKPAEKPDAAQEDKENAEVHAKEIGGEVVWQKGPFALVRGYSILTGDPVYVATYQLYRLRGDLEGWTGNLIGGMIVPDDIKTGMIAAKKAAEKEAEAKHKKKPFIKFKDGVAVSDGISPEIEGIIRGWKDILKLDVPIYVGTIEDARINKNNYTGPHRRIGSGTLDEGERGSARRMSDGSFYILFKGTTSPTLMLETLAHEMGHIHEKLVFENATPEEKQALRDAHQKWLSTQKDKTAQELVNALRARATQRKTKVPEGMTAEQLTSYWKSFGEWYADQVSRWAVSGVVPVGVVEKFFKRLGNQLRRFYQILKNARYLPDETFAQYIEKVTSRPANLAPSTQDVADRMVEGFEPIKKFDVLQNIEPKDKGEQSGFAFDVNATDQIAKNNPTVAQNLARANQLPGAKKKLPPGRSPELAAAAQQVQAGLMTAKEYDELVNRYKPIPVYFAPLKPATSQEVYNALDVAKREKINPDIKEGYPVGLRLDIPAFNRHGVYVVSIHEKRTPSAPGKVIGYGSVARIKDVTFGVGNQREALKIATGEAKDAIQTMEGKYVPITPEQAYEMADNAILSGDWVQMGIDPTRHAYFFDRRTTLPVVAAQEVIQIGNTILARGVTFGKKEDFLYNIASDQPDLFGYEEPKGDKKVPQVVKRGRVPELTEAAEQLRRGEITKKEYDAKVKKFSPVSLYAEPPKPSTDKQVNDAVDSSKRQYANVEIKTGTRVGTRIDVPAWENKNTWVVSIHAPKPSPTSPKASQILSYRSVAKLKNVVFGIGDQKRSLRIAAGEFKDKLQTMEGEYVDISPEEAYKTAQELINDQSYVQVGFNPFRHAYFYDRSTMQPVVKADEVLQIGNFILAKNPTYGEKADFLYDLTAEPSLAAQEGELEFGNTREQQIRRYAAINRKKATIEAKVAKGEVSIDLQRQLNRLRKESVALQAAIKATAPRRDSAERFMARALQEYDDGNISAEVLAVVQQVYQKYPDILEGLLLSVRKSDGSNALGTFAALDRIITLFKGTSGVDDPSTIRHELAHSLEQVMLPSQAMVVVQAWGKALARAIKQNPDEVHQRYFDAVLDFIDNPSMRTLKIAQDLLPSYDMYQFINPSEYWAINAENLMAAQLGSAWDKFKKALNKIFQAIKDIFGFNNTYAVHKVFDQVMNGKRERMTYGVLVSMVQGTGDSFVTLNNIQDEKELMEKYSRPKTPMLDQTPTKTFITRQFKNGKEFFSDAAKNPKEAMVGSGNAVMDGLIYMRNKNVWYGSGLEARDFDRYNGELRTSEGMATASVALDNAIRSGNIGVEVIFQGGIAYDKDKNNFVAVKRKLGMKGVYEAEAAIKARLGDQLGTDIVQGYLEAKRSISIMDELYEREAALEDAKQNLEAMRALKRSPEEIAQAQALVKDLESDVDAINKAVSSVNMSEEEMGEFAALDQKHPELRDLMENWNAINQNLLKFWRQVGLLSAGRYEKLSAIKDYVPWYRIMNDEEDIHSPIQSTTRSMANIGREKLFKRGKPISVVDFRAKAGQQDFKIQPSSVVKVKVNGQAVDPDKVSVTSSGEVRIDMPLEENDLVVFETNREIENIIDNMTRNVMRMTMNGIRQFAANRIVLEYASRNENGKIMVFPNVDKDKGRFNWIVNGKKVVVEIQDPLVAASIYGMENLNLQMWAPLAAVANFTRRTITLSGVFQIKQVFKDAPTAALVTGVKNPLALIGGVYKGFITSLTNTDPVVDILKAAGIGGYMSPARTPEAEIKRRLGIMNRNVFDFVIKGLDHIGDASDMAQRVATYKRVMAETGDETQALYQAANVINFLHHGSAGYAQAIVKTVPFMGAYANATDVLVRALVGGGLKGMSRKKALARLGITMAILSSLTLLYAMLAGGDPEYDELDDQTKLRNIIIPGTKIMLPMNTSAAYFFKAIPELIYNKVTREGTENEMDRKRLRKALADAARDMLLGPEPIPAGVKPVLEVAINHSFFTGRPVIPEGMKDLEAAEQYTAATSELGKRISAMLEIPGTDGKRVISPIEADHLIRGIFGTAGAMGQWISNSIGAMAETRPAPTARETPITGSFLRPEIPRGREDLFYDFKEKVDKKYATYMKMIEREDDQAAEAYLQKHGDLVAMKEYITETENELKEINAEIRRIGTTRSKDMSPQERRREMDDYQRLKIEILEPVKEMRREAFGAGFVAK